MHWNVGKYSDLILVTQIVGMMQRPEHPNWKVDDSLGEGTRETLWEGGVMLLILWVLGREQDTF